MTKTIPCHASNSQLALIYCGLRLANRVLKSQAGHYIGTADQDGPCSRESVEYYRTQAQADTALATGQWTQRDEP